MHSPPRGCRRLRTVCAARTARPCPACWRARCRRRRSHVEDVLGLVELDGLRHSLVGVGVGGGADSGLSLEQRKRLSIAVELVANPSVVFMDEPTSGLDGHAAAVVMRVTRAVANMQRTIVCTIHQVRPGCAVGQGGGARPGHPRHRSERRGQEAAALLLPQPSAEIFYNFDMLVLLQNGGHMMYFGPLGARTHLWRPRRCRLRRRRRC